MKNGTRQHFDCSVTNSLIETKGKAKQQQNTGHFKLQTALEQDLLPSCGPF